MRLAKNDFFLRSSKVQWLNYHSNKKVTQSQAAQQNCAWRTDRRRSQYGDEQQNVANNGNNHWGSI